MPSSQIYGIILIFYYSRLQPWMYDTLDASMWLLGVKINLSQNPLAIMMETLMFLHISFLQMKNECEEAIDAKILYASTRMSNFPPLQPMQRCSST